MYLLFDIGGTKMRVAVSRDGQTFLEPEIITTPETPQQIAEALKNLADQLSNNEPLQIVCGGLTRKKLSAGDEIRKLFSCPVYIENDTAVVGLGEAVSGAGQGSKILAYLTISTGVGGVRLVDGQIDHQAEGFEPGHQIIDYHDPLKHLEDYISGTAVRARTGQAPHTITDPLFWAEMARLAAVGVHNVIVHWSPDVVVVGGSMMKKVGIPIDLLRQEITAISKVYKICPEIRLATLEDLGGLYGALALARLKVVI